jgi:hypothetical protein
VADVGDDDRHPVLPGRILTSGTPNAPDGETSPPPGSREHATQASWSRILATTLKLWVLRRVQPFGPGRLGQVAMRRWHLAVLILALAAVGAAAAGFAELSRTAAPAGQASGPGDSSAGAAARAGTPAASSPAAAAAAQAAAWVAGQVSSGAIIACDPAICAMLQAQGVNASRLMPMQPGSDYPVSATVVVTSSPMSSRLADEYAPAVIASFGSGQARVGVRATEPGGAAAYQTALRADLAARLSAGAQLLRNRRIQFTGQDAAQLRAGEVDSRLLATLAALSSQYSFRVTAFGDAAPGVQVLYRAVTVTIGGNGNRTAELAAALALVTAQDPPYQPAHAVIIHPAAGQPALSIEFAAPSPLGLLTTVLAADQRPAAARALPIAHPVRSRKIRTD